jgi:hypothetical protein
MVKTITNNLALLFLCIFLLIAGSCLSVGFDTPLLRGIAGISALVAGFLGLLEFGFRFTSVIETPPKHKTHHKHDSFLIFVICLGLVGVTKAANPLDVESSRWAAAECVAMNVTDSTPSPTPGPSPTPSGQCGRCNGTGKIKPDGRIEIACPDCGGDGIVQIPDLTRAIATLNDRLNETRVDLGFIRDEHKKLTQQQPSVNQAVFAGVPQTQGPPEPQALGNVKSGAPFLKSDVWEDVDFSSWISSTDQIQWMVQKWKRPAFIFWSAEVCEPCDRAKKNIFADSKIKEYLERNFICCYIDASKMTQSQRDDWEVTVVPSYSLIDEKWDTIVKIKREIDSKDKFMDNLTEGMRDIPKQSLNQRTTYRSFASQSCRCSETGVCDCGDSCACPNCPVHIQRLYTNW